MKLPITWLQDYVDIKDSPKQVADDFTVIGLMLDKPIEDDVLDLEQRLNRADLLSVLGCARDYAAFKKLPLKMPSLTSPAAKPMTAETEVKLTVDTPTVRRFNTRVIKGLKVGKSPQWLSSRLEAYGMESKNNLVDITNYVMLELGQPMHAQDLAKMPARELHLRENRAGESITTLLGTHVTLPTGTFIVSTGGLPCVIGGVVGGVITGVTSNTTDIILDSGNYDQRVVRHNSRKLKIVNESVARYDKYLDPRLTEVALYRACELILELCGGTLYENHDYYPAPVIPQSLPLTYDRLLTISGMHITPGQVKDRLKRLGFTILHENAKGLELELPYWRTDLEVEDDLVSEILRLGNYNTIPQVPLTTPVPRDITPTLYRFEQSLRDNLLALGAHEQITSPLVAYDGIESRVKLENSLSVEENSLRLDLAETLTSSMATYRKHGFTQIPLFEIGKSFALAEDKVVELRQLTLVSPRDVRSYLTSLMISLGIKYRLVPREQDKVSIMVGKEVLGALTDRSFTLLTDALHKHYSPFQNVRTEVPSHTSLDLSLVLPSNTPFSELEAVIRRTSPSLRAIQVLEHYPAKSSLLIRLTWEKLKDADETRRELIKSLSGLGVISRSG